MHIAEKQSVVHLRIRVCSFIQNAIPKIQEQKISTNFAGRQPCMAEILRELAPIRALPPTDVFII